MSERITVKQLEAAVERLNRELGRPLAAWTREADGKLRGNIGHLSLSAQAPGDGVTRYRLEEMTSVGGAVNDVGPYCLGSREAWIMLQAMEAAFRMKKES